MRIAAGPARGVTMTLDFSGQTPMYLGMFEWELHTFLRRVLSGARLVFDIGGYIGYDALMFAANCPGRVVTFEPNPARIKTIRENIARNPTLEPRVELAGVAVGDQDGEGITKLDTFIQSSGAPDFVKIDVDGGELDALTGAMSLLREQHPNLVVETHSHELEQECGRLLVECGYRPVIKHNRRVWREHRAGVPHNRWLLAERSAASETREL